MQTENVRKSHNNDARGNLRVYFWPKGESLLEQLQNRRDRPVEEFRALLPKVLKEAFPLLDEQGLDLVCSTANWSQKAGCKCGCSPGFIVRELRANRLDVHCDVVA